MGGFQPPRPLSAVAPALSRGPLTTARGWLGSSAGLLNYCRRGVWVRAQGRDDGVHKYTFAIPRRIAPGFCKIFRPEEGVGNAGCQRTRSRACSVVSTRVSHHGYAETPGIPARNGFNGFLRDLPGDRAFLSPSSLRSLLLKNLTPASRRQDHTTSPSALAPFVKGAAASIASRTNVRDDRETPL
jgi:hypothetical protein